MYLTNNFALPAITIFALYKARWQVKLFFKCIKQHHRIKKVFGTSGNAVKSQIWIAVSVYVLVAIVKKRLNLDASLYTLLQIFSLTLFEKMPIQQAFKGSDYILEQHNSSNQLNLYALNQTLLSIYKMFENRLGSAYRRFCIFFISFSANPFLSSY